jgi:hypothetical protein
MCNFGSRVTVLDIGTPSSPLPTALHDGDTSAGSQVAVACAVTPVGNGFDVTLSAAISGPMGGSLTIDSPSGLGAVTATGGTGIASVFESAGAGTYSGTACTIAFTYKGGAVPTSPPIAPGRIWGHISCPTATSSAPASSGDFVPQCDAEADFLFENCQ